MSTILTQLASSLSQGVLTAPSTVQIKLSAPLPAPAPAASPTPSTPAPAPQAVTLTVISALPSGQTVLQMPNGTQLTAQVLPPPAPGSQITIPPAAAQSLANPPAANTPIQVLTARISPPLPPNPSTPSSLGNTAPRPGASTPPNPAQLLTEGANLPNPTLLAAIANPSLPGPTLPKQLTSAIQQLFQNTIISNPQQSIPTGPLELAFRQPLPETFLQTPTTLTLNGPSTGTLTAPGQPPQPVMLAAPSTLPQRTPIALTFLPNAGNPAQPTAILTQPLEANNTGTPRTPFTPPALSALRVLLGNESAPIPTATPLTARVLAQPNTAQQFAGQPLRLATGHTAVLQSPLPIPVESTLVVEFPTVAGLAQVLRIQPAGQQAPQTQPQGQPAAPIATQTPQAVLPAGITVQGTLSGTNQQGQPLLTISQPSQYAGQSIPLTLSDNLHSQIPIGTQLSVRVEANGAPATLLALTLPPSVSRAHTLTTLGAQWPGLQQALNLLSTQAPAVAHNMQARIPQLAALLPGLLAFTEALRRNDPDAAFGKEATTLLRAMGVNMGADVQQLSQLQQPQADNAWRGTLFPYVENQGQDPRQGGFFWRREKKDDPRASTNTRFIMQLSLSQMGEVQLDGLINYPDLWLKLRRTTPPESGFVEGLQTMVNATLQTYGLSGGIAVEVAPAFPVNPLAEMLSATPNPLPTSA